MFSKRTTSKFLFTVLLLVGFQVQAQIVTNPDDLFYSQTHKGGTGDSGDDNIKRLVRSLMESDPNFVYKTYRDGTDIDAMNAINEILLEEYLQGNAIK